MAEAHNLGEVNKTCRVRWNYK